MAVVVKGDWTRSQRAKTRDRNTIADVLDREEQSNKEKGLIR